MANPFDLLTAGSFSDDEDAGLDAGREEGAPNDPWTGEDFTEDDVGTTTEEIAWCQLTEAIHCLATFKDAKQGLTRVCGNRRAECNRKGHTTKRASRGPPGFYATLPPLSKASKVDGDVRFYKSVEMMEVEAQEAEAHLRREMESLATSNVYAEPVAEQESRVGHTADSPLEDAAVRHIRTISDQMETTFDRATADALASPSPPPRVGLAERVRQSLRSASRVGSSRVSSDETQDGLSRARGAASTYMKTIREVSGLVTALPHKYSPERDRIAKRQAQLDEQVRAFQALKEQEEFDRLQQEEVDQDEEEAIYLRQAAAKYAHAEDLLAAMKPAAVPTSPRVSAFRPPPQPAVRHPGILKPPSHEVAAQRELAALRAKVATQEAALERIHLQALRSAGGPPNSIKSPPPQEDQVAALEAKLAHMKTTGRHGNPMAQPSGSGVTAIYYQPPIVDPQVARLHAQNAAFKARLAGQSHRTAGPPPGSMSAYEEHLTQLLADLEEQEKLQDSHHPLPQVAESPDARRIADLEATIQLMSAKIDGLNKAGHTGTGGKFGEAARPPAGELITTPASGPSTVSGTSGRFSFEDIVTAKKDDSDGDKIFGVSIRMPQKVLEALCPKGMSDSTRTQIAEAGLDVASLPGKYRTSSAMDFVDVHQEIANSMGQAMELVRDQQNSLRARDLSFNSERRNALGSIKTQDQLLSFKEELDDSSDEALDSAENRMRSVLSDLGLEEEVIEYFVTTSQFPTIIKKTLEFYKALVDHLVNLSTKYGFGHAQTDLEHYTHKLLIRRKGSQCRLEVLLKVYCDLRDGHRNKFIDSKLQQKKNGQLFLKSLTSTPVKVVHPPKDGGTPAPAATPKGCKRCGSKLHPNTTNCPLWHEDVLPSVSRKLAKECQNAVDFVAAAKAALAKHLANRGADAGPPPPAPGPADELLEEHLIHQTPDAFYVQRRVAKIKPSNTNTYVLDWTLGTFQGGPTLLPTVWERATHVFEVDPLIEHIRAKFPSRPQAQAVSDTPNRTPRDILNLFPVDLLVLDHSRDYNVAAAFQVPPMWYSWLEACTPENRPGLLLQVWQQWATGSDRGPLDALQRKFLSRMGYESRYELLNTVDYGSPVTQARLVILSYRLQDATGVAFTTNKFADWFLQPPDNLPPRPMSNCLRPFGAGKVTSSPTDDTDPMDVPNSTTDPMPSGAGSWIKTSTGFRRLFADELAKGLGVPTRWAPLTHRLKSVALNSLLGTHAWEAIGNSLVALFESIGPNCMSLPAEERGNCGSGPLVLASAPSSPHESSIHAPDHPVLSNRLSLPSEEQGGCGSCPPFLSSGPSSLQDSSVLVSDPMVLPTRLNLPAGEQGTCGSCPPFLATGPTSPHEGSVHVPDPMVLPNQLGLSTEEQETCGACPPVLASGLLLPPHDGSIPVPDPRVPSNRSSFPAEEHGTRGSCPHVLASAPFSPPDGSVLVPDPMVLPNHQNLRIQERGNAAVSPAVLDPTAIIQLATPPVHAHWEWSTPDLRPNRAWHKRRIQTLKRAVSTYPDDERQSMVAHGKADLSRHRENYGANGAVYLQVLWWEFPPEHWEPLRTGCSMNFLQPPSVTIMPNGRMTEEQTDIAVEFFEELMNLGVLELAPIDDPILGNAPLFCIPKAGQPGQWRVLANMKEGRQNDAIGNEPVYLPRVGTILPHMYSSGWSATVDASKFFYQFPTVVSERKYLGCTHPTTGLHYRYRGLPMGAGNSPAIAGRMGATVLRKLRERHPALFGGEPYDNTWQTTNELGETRHTDTRYGRGRVLLDTSRDGSPAVLTWVHVDDFLFHGPTFTKTAASLSAFMDLALELGLLCNPTKTVPPTQVVKYCGFLYDTTAEPQLIIPPEKRSRARVQVQYTLRHANKPFSRLALSVVNGVLQSLVDATPTRIGQTYLRALHDLISDENDVVDPTARFYTTCVFTPEARDNLKWWEVFLARANSRPIRPSHSATIGCAWGDGSGTGTGGTNEILGDPGTTMRMWMGTWAPHVHQFSSNWRELKTLSLTLEQEVDTLRETGTSRFTDRTLLYFTDNMTAYHITTAGSSKSQSLHRLVKQIKHMELQLNCHLEVVHVPGTTMIIQGTDGISRGVWLSPLHEHRSSESLLGDLFAPVRFCPPVFAWVAQANPFYASQLTMTPWTHVRWDQNWVGHQLLDRFSLWTPPPEMASQAISFLLQAWVERPHTTSALFFIPRILQREWRKLSKHIIELAPLLPTMTSAWPTVHLLPVTVLYLPKFVPCLLPPSHRVDEPAVPTNARWHRQQADLLRGLSPSLEQPGSPVEMSLPADGFHPEER